MTAARDAEIISGLNLNLIYAINTHVHRDHISGTHKLRSYFPQLKTGLGSAAKNAKSDEKFTHLQILNVGDISLEARHTPGHTKGCVTYVEHGLGLAFTGDTVLIRGCGRTDFQEGREDTKEKG